MKRHLINFILLAIMEIGAIAAASVFGLRHQKQSRDMQKQVDFMRQAHNVFVADQQSLASQAAEGQAYRDYKTQWEARLREYDTPSEVLEILNAEASRAGVSAPRSNDTKGDDTVFDLTVFGRLNELVRWLAAAEARIDLLQVDELVLTSQVDASLSLTVRAHLLGGLLPKAGPTPPPTAPSRRAPPPPKK